MAQRPSRYSDTRDYDHAFHAGNVGDVLKHCALRAWVSALQASGPPDRPLQLVDTHAGAGMFKLPAQGEWQQGIGLLDSADLADAPAVVRGYLDAARAKRGPKGGLYPGSPAFVRQLMRRDDRLGLYELMDQPRAKLTTHYASDAQVTVTAGDGLAGLVAVASDAPEGRRLAALIDPPYVSRAEWDAVAAQVIAAKAACPGLAVCIWYPIKSQVRPRGLEAKLRNAGIPGASIDLVHTPLRLQRKRLNGSGMIFIEPPRGLLVTLVEAAAWLGERVATDDEWTTITTGWRAPTGS